MAEVGPRQAAPYLRVAAGIRQGIADGTWAPGDRLPSRGELGSRYGVGENVVRRAQELLITQGLLEGRSGAGTFVRSPVERRTLPRIPDPAAVATAAAAGTRPVGAGPAPAGFTGTWEADSTAKTPAPDRRPPRHPARRPVCAH